MAYTDSDWVANKATRQSVTGYFFKIANGIFSWRSQAQKAVAVFYWSQVYGSIPL
jgi:hypothetical protein